MDWGTFTIVQWIGIIGYILLAVSLMIWKQWGQLQRQTSFVAVGCLLLHMGAAVLYGVIHQVWYGQADTFKLFESGLALHAIANDSPATFLKLLLSYGGGPPPIVGDPEAFAFWQHPTSFTLVKLHAIMAFITGGYYYTHAILMGWLAYMGSSYVYNRWISKFPDTNESWVLAGLMLFPSVLLYGSGLHKEAVVILAFSLVITPLLPNGLVDTWQKAMSLLVGVWLLWLVKEFYLWAIVPGIVALTLSQLWNSRPWIWFAITTLLVIAATILFHYYLPALDPVRILAERQHEFMALQGNTNVTQHRVVDIPTLVAAGLQGLVNVWLRPWPTEWTSFRLVLYGLENYVLFGLWLWTIFTYWRVWPQKTMLLFVLSTILFSALITGIVVPNLGAIARYKSPMEFLMIIFILFWAKRRKLHPTA